MFELVQTPLSIPVRAEVTLAAVVPLLCQVGTRQVKVDCGGLCRGLCGGL